MTPRQIPLSRPCFKGREEDYLRECIRTGWVSSGGPYVVRFEEEFARAVGAKHAVSCSTGTAALHVALVVLGAGRGNRVYVPDLTFIATANPVRYCGAAPVLVDVDEVGYGMEPAALERVARAARPGDVVLPAHLYGEAAAIAALAAVAARLGAPLLEDATEGLGTTVDGKQVGTFGVAGCFSFNGNKLITSGGGGMLVTSDAALAERARYLTTQARDHAVEYVHGAVGFNYRMTNLQAAVGLAQLERLDEIVADRRRVARLYEAALRDIPGLRPEERPAGTRPSHWLYSIRLDRRATAVTPMEMVARAAPHGVQLRPFFTPLHRQAPYRRAARGAYPGAERLHADYLSVPIYEGMTDSEVDQVASAVRAALAPGT